MSTEDNKCKAPKVDTNDKTPKTKHSTLLARLAKANIIVHESDQLVKINSKEYKLQILQHYSAKLYVCYISRSFLVYYETLLIGIYKSQTDLINDILWSDKETYKWFISEDRKYDTYNHFDSSLALIMKTLVYADFLRCSHILEIINTLDEYYLQQCGSSGTIKCTNLFLVENNKKDTTKHYYEGEVLYEVDNKKYYICKYFDKLVLTYDTHTPIWSSYYNSENIESKLKNFLLKQTLAFNCDICTTYTEYLKQSVCSSCPNNVPVLSEQLKDNNHIALSMLADDQTSRFKATKQKGYILYYNIGKDFPITVFLANEGKNGRGIQFYKPFLVNDFTGETIYGKTTNDVGLLAEVDKLVNGWLHITPSINLNEVET